MSAIELEVELLLCLQRSCDTALRTVLGYRFYISLVNLREECGWAGREGGGGGKFVCTEGYNYSTTTTISKTLARSYKCQHVGP